MQLADYFNCSGLSPRAVERKTKNTLIKLFIEGINMSSIDELDEVVNFVLGDMSVDQGRFNRDFKQIFESGLQAVENDRRADEAIQKLEDAKKEYEFTHSKGVDFS